MTWEHKKNVLLVIDPANILIHIGDPVQFDSDKIVEYAKSGHTIKTITLVEWSQSGMKLYEPLIDPLLAAEREKVRRLVEALEESNKWLNADDLGWNHKRSYEINAQLIKEYKTT